MRSAGRINRPTNHKPATRHARIVTRATGTIEGRFESEAEQHTEPNSQCVLHIGLVAEVPIRLGEANQMTYSLTISLLPLVFCVLGIVGGYYIFRS